MRRIVVWLSLLGTLSTIPLAAQDSTPKPPDSTHVDSTPPPPSPEQIKWMQGLRTASRGIGQIKTGIDLVQRAQGGGDPAHVHSAGKLLAGYCGTARGFMRSGVARMSATAYTGDGRNIARQVVTQIDSVIKESITCEQQAAHDPKVSIDRLATVIRGYEAAIAAWRAMVGLPQLAAPRPPSQ
ncbi:MAG TPA: hypothetical protein VMC86_13055 [Gemmatimonadales bacterium]|nr:hypothetical protein [Gemmatimonadales bacterium]